MSAQLVDTETGEVLSTDLALPDVNDVALADDPAQQIVLACERANAWLQSGIAVPIESIVETKAQAAALATFAIQKQLGKDAEISALEVQRRAERGTGLAIRRGQEAGQIRRQGQGRGYTQQLPKPTDFATHDELMGNGAGIYEMTDDVSDERFDEAINAAKTEGNCGLLNLAENTRRATGNAKSHCVAAAAVEIYNRGRAARSGARLPDWFRENA